MIHKTNHRLKKAIYAGLSILWVCPNPNPLWAQQTATVQQSIPAQQPTTAQQYHERARSFLDKGELELALADLNKAIELEVKSASAYSDRAFAHTHLKQYDKALADYTQAIALEPKDAEAYLDRGTLHYGLNRLSEALRDYKQALALEPKNNRAIQGIEFIEHSQAIQANPKVAANYLARGKVAVALNDFDTAIADYSKAIELEPQNAEFFNQRGIAYAKHRKPEAALADYDKALALNPNLVAAYLNRMAVLGNTSAASRTRVIADATQVIRLEPQNVTAHLVRAEALRWEKNFDAAITDYTRVLQLAPENQEARKERGIVYFHKGDYDRARADLDAIKADDFSLINYRGVLNASKAIQQNPQDASNYLWRAGLYMGDETIGYSEVQDHAKALADLATAIRLDPKNARAFALRAKIYGDESSAVKDYDKAIADASQSLRLDKDNAAVYNHRGNLFLFKGDYDQAVADYIAATNLDPGYASGSYHRDLHSAEADWDKAIAHYSSALQRDPKNADATFKRGFFHSEFREKVNQWNSAIDDYTRAIQLDPRNAQAYLLRGIARGRRIEQEGIQRSQEKRKESAADITREQQEMALALDDYTQAIRLDPGLAPAYYYRAQAYTANEDVDLDRALADYSQFIRLRPRQAGHTHFSRGRLYLAKGQWDNVIADVDAYFRLERPITLKYLTSMDISGIARRMRADAYLMKNEWDKAIADYTEAGDGMAGMNITAYNLGNVYRRKGDHERAVAEYTRALESTKDSSYIPALEGRAESYRKLGKNDLAQADVKRIEALKAAEK
jgi:tetratricopeptide (TPR) repeat protein